MQVRFLQNLGGDDCRLVKQQFNAALDPKECVIGAVCEVPDAAATYLAEKHKFLFEAIEPPTRSVRGQAKVPELTAPAKT